MFLCCNRILDKHLENDGSHRDDRICHDDGSRRDDRICHDDYDDDYDGPCLLYYIHSEKL